MSLSILKATQAYEKLARNFLASAAIAAIILWWSTDRLHGDLWVYDKTSGEMLAEIRVGSNASGSPIIYSVDGKQYIVLPVGGGANVPEELVAVGLPWGV
jgi:hypothetical protein